MAPSQHSARHLHILRSISSPGTTAASRCPPLASRTSAGSRRNVRLGQDRAMSWRDSASETAQIDRDGLLDLCLPFAREQLDQNGEFFPFGAVVNSEGVRSLYGAGPGAGERPASSDVHALLVDGMRREGWRGSHRTPMMLVSSREDPPPKGWSSVISGAPGSPV
jgi:hypothetical protein